MAHAMVYEARQGERTDLKDTSSETKEVPFSAARLSQARAVLRHSAELARSVLAGAMSRE